MKEIKNIKTLEELARHDKKIRAYAKVNLRKFSFLRGDQDAIDDIVNNMYLKLYKKLEVKKEVVESFSYIASVMVNLANDMAKDKAIIIYNEDTADNHITGAGESISTLFDRLESIETDIEKEIEFKEFEDRLNFLTWYEKEVLILSYTYRMSELSRLSGVSYKALNTTLNRALEIVFKDNKKEILEHIKNSRCESQEKNY